VESVEEEIPLELKPGTAPELTSPYRVPKPTGVEECSSGLAMNNTSMKLIETHDMLLQLVQHAETVFPGEFDSLVAGWLCGSFSIHDCGQTAQEILAHVRALPVNLMLICRLDAIVERVIKKLSERLTHV